MRTRTKSSTIIIIVTFLPLAWKAGVSGFSSLRESGCSGELVGVKELLSRSLFHASWLICRVSELVTINHYIYNSICLAFTSNRFINNFFFVQLVTDAVPCAFSSIHSGFSPAVDTCASSPCRHGGSCVRQSSGYRCMCTEDYFGLRCNRRKTRQVVRRLAIASPCD